MKTVYLLAGIAAVMSLGACNSEKKDTAAVNPAAETVKVDPPKSGDWAEIVIATPQGGFQMGNPNAKVKLVEYGSMTCPHCREFDETGVGPLTEKYVKNGQVAYEFRNFVRDPLDVTGSMITRCNGPKSFFPLTRAMFADQANWFAKIQAAPQKQMEQLSTLPPAQQFAQMASIAGFQQWAAMRGVPSAKSNACLANQGEADRLVQMNSDAVSTYNVSGTPTFIINGKVVDAPPTWAALEPEIKKALK